MGELFPHYHLLVYGVSLVDFRGWFAENWWEVCGKLSEAHRKAGTQAKMIIGYRQVMGYVSKYMAKVERSKIPAGRVWGVCNIELLPWVREIKMIVEEREAVQLIRYMRRKAKIKGRDYRALSIFCDPNQWFYQLDRLLYPE